MEVSEVIEEVLEEVYQGDVYNFCLKILIIFGVSCTDGEHLIEIQDISEAEQEVLHFQEQESDPMTTNDNVDLWRSIYKAFSCWLEYGDRPQFVRCSMCCVSFKALTKDDLVQHSIQSKHQEIEAKFKSSTTPTKLDLLLEDEDLRSWFTVDEHGQPFCSCCQAYLRGGKKDLLRHAKTEKHLKFLITPNSEYSFLC